MTARLTIALRSPGLILGVRGIDVLLDGEPVHTIGFGETTTVECAAGDRTLQLKLNAVLNRRSNTLRLTVADGEERALAGRYSRMWGTLRLREA